MDTKHSLFFTLLLCTTIAFSQTTEKKITTAKRISGSISIDGKLDEKEWENVPVAKDFINFSPDSGMPEDPNKKTEVKIIYDNDAIYVGATMFDDKPQDIMKEIKLRDEYGSSDHFGVFFNGFNDGQQEFRFYISAAGVQIDALATSAGDDNSWDAIWDCKVKITDFGWVAEYKIPYAALRFGKEKVQTWGVNMYREIRKSRYSYCWNHIDFTLNNEVVQGGILKGIENIQTPTRLFFIPYTSFYHTNNDSGNDNKFKAGMDIKYGINDAFTLDAILVPDFGQTTFDNVVLNLGPFEQQFAENRPFFTEGTDMFNKGGLFYSRRIGESYTLDRYTYESNLDNDTELLEYPSTVNVLNAIKISGRNKKGLGIGFLNTVTDKVFAKTFNTTTQTFEKELVEPVSNYNILILDQRFRQNSSISFINTNLTREGNARDGNVSALVLDLNTKDNGYKLYSDFKYSYVNDLYETYDGHSASIYLGDTKGKYQYGIGGTHISKNYDINDMGINFYTNYYGINANSSYRILNPNKMFNTFSINGNIETEFENTTGKLQNGYVNFDLNSTTKKNDYFGAGIVVSPFEIFDFYNPRVYGRYNFTPEHINLYAYISTNYNRKYAIDISPSYTVYNQEERKNYKLGVSHLFRASDKLFLKFTSTYRKQQNDQGWIDIDTNDDIIYARRDVKSLENILSGKFSINNVMNFNLKVRHYWSFAQNKENLTLLNNGYFETNSTYSENKNSNLNLWNFDLSYSWWFAPGSLVSIMYRNNSDLFEREFNTKFRDNFDNVLSNDPNNTISISLRYYIDYNEAKNFFKKD